MGNPRQIPGLEWYMEVKYQIMDLKHWTIALLIV